MSYSIIYGSNFIKTNCGVIPLFLTGSNNCTEYINGREVRERSWSLLFDLDDTNLAGSDALFKIQSTFPDTDEQRSIKIGSDFKTNRQLRKYFTSALKSAATLEEYWKYNPGVCLKCWVYDTNPNIELRYSDKKFIGDTKELEEWIKRFCAKKSKTQIPVIEFSSRKPLRKPCYSEGEVIAKSRYGYFSKKSNYGMTWCHQRENAYIFNSVDEALKTLSGYSFRLIKANSGLKPKPKPYAVKVTSGLRAGYFVNKNSRSRLSFTKENPLKKFESVKLAEKYIEHIKPKWPESRVGHYEVVCLY